TFEMLFRTPNHFGFAAVGTIIDSTVVEDVMTTRYRVSDPAPNVSFNIGIFTTHRLTEKEILPKGVHFTNPRHKELLNGLTLHTVAHNRDVEKHVARDVMGSLQLFEHHFGQLPIDKLVVAEILALHSESYPGFVQMGLMTFLRSDPSGYQRMHRSHEVAHQWWGFGSGVGFKTYHDKWLSEGFAEYSGMLFQEETSGHKKFLEVLKEYREEIFGARKYLLTSGAESGPIIMGSRTASTKTKGDFDLVIYKKAALVLHMLRNLLMDLGNFSDERFYSMMKDWYLTNRGRQMTTNDFKEHCDKHFGIDMAWFFDQWVYGNDLPTYRFSYECKRDTGGVFVCPCEVKTENVGPAFQMYVPIEIEMRDKQKFYYRQLITGPTTVFDIAGLEDMPKKLRFNPFESVLADVKQ
ncbi:MAG: M1 family aminopeptidase, partial [candidate division Zixibacteria bacterium]|nr:M1 family aminopeptidase [candidate division Zixibacteria bacterium]